MSQELPFGRYLEDFSVGEVYKHWPGKTVTEYDDHLFCMITMNHHPLHTNRQFAETSTEFKRNVVAGNLIYSLALGMSVRDVSGRAIANLEIENLKHPAPVFHGDTIYAETEVLEITPSKSKPDRGIVRVRTIAYNQDGVVVCEFVRRVMIPTRESMGTEQPGRPQPVIEEPRGGGGGVAAPRGTDPGAPDCEPPEIRMTSRVAVLCWEESRSWVSTLRQKGYSVPWVEEPKGDVHNQIAGIEADLLLVDLTRLPEKGKEMVSELASKGALKNLPVILVSQKPNASHGLKGKVGALTVTTPAKIISAVRSALSEK